MAFGLGRRIVGGGPVVEVREMVCRRRGMMMMWKFSYNR
jgi:hypothetical protein